MSKRHVSFLFFTVLITVLITEERRLNQMFNKTCITIEILVEEGLAIFLKICYFYTMVYFGTNKPMHCILF